MLSFHGTHPISHIYDNQNSPTQRGREKKRTNYCQAVLQEENLTLKVRKNLMCQNVVVPFVIGLSKVLTSLEV